MPFDESEAIRLGRDFTVIQDTAEWKSVLRMKDMLCRDWTDSLLRIKTYDVNTVAMERMKLASMIHGLATLFTDIETGIELFKAAEKEARQRERKMN